ncbi:MAG: thiol-disulfide oxidoreductase DCC family protein [Candidatus Dormibacteraceae bacterium]
MSDRLLLVYDGGCGFCRRCVRYLRERDLGDRIEPVSNLGPGVEQRTGLTRVQLDRSVWVLDGKGGRATGAAAINQALRALRGPYGWLGALGGAPGIAPLEQLAYDLIAPRRSRLSRLWSDPPSSR